MKRLTAFVLLLALTFSFAACAANRPVSGNQPGYEEVWADILNGYEEPKMEQHSYGTFDGCKVMLTILGDHTTKGSTAEIGGCAFFLTEDSSLQVYRDTELMTLEEAFAEGYLSGESIRQIFAVHQSFMEEKMIKSGIMETLAAMDGVSLHNVRIYGEDNGYHIVFTELEGVNYAMTLTIAGESFRFSDDFLLLAYKDGKVMNLEYAYRDGLVSEEAIAKAAKIHREY